MLNVLTIDVEDYYHVTAFEPYLGVKEAGVLPSRVECNVNKILELLDSRGIKATFFVLGCVARELPYLVRMIHDEGHEVACHGYMHKLVYESTPEEFRSDIKKAKHIIEDSTGTNVCGFRATSFSFNESNLWALDILIEEGFSYDSSIFPIRRSMYGIPCWQRFPHLISRNGGRIYELPPSTISFLKNNIPVAGGAYLRFLPLSIITWGIKRINQVEQKPAVLYLHPWEIDTGQPMLRVSSLTRLRHYKNIEKVESKIKKILSEFRFGTAADLVKSI